MSTQIYWQIEDGALAIMMKNWGLVTDQSLHKIQESKKESPSGLNVQQGIAIIPIQGAITPTPDFFSALFGGNTSLDVLTAQITEAMERTDVDSVLYDVNSGGGRASGVDKVAYQMFQASQMKPSASQISGVMGSAAYYLGSQANKIYFSDRTDMAGSIGTRIILEDTSEHYKEMGIKVIPIHTGNMKSVGIDGLPITEDQIAVMQDHVDTLQGFFEEAVLRGRQGVDISKVNSGAVFLAQESINLGLADGIQSVQTTIQQLMDKVDIDRSMRNVSRF